MLRIVTLLCVFCFCCQHAVAQDQWIEAPPTEHLKQRRAHVRYSEKGLHLINGAGLITTQSGRYEGGFEVSGTVVLNDGGDYSGVLNVHTHTSGRRRNAGGGEADGLIVSFQSHKNRISLTHFIDEAGFPLHSIPMGIEPGTRYGWRVKEFKTGEGTYYNVYFGRGKDWDKTPAATWLIPPRGDLNLQGHRILISGREYISDQVQDTVVDNVVVKPAN